MIDNYRYRNNDILIKMVESLKYDFPIKRISEEMNTDKGNLSSYINKKKPHIFPIYYYFNYICFNHL